MTSLTPTPPQPFHTPHPAYAPRPTPPWRAKGTMMAVGLTALVVLLAGVGTLAWWLTRDVDDSPLAGRPRVNNTAAGLSYAIPAGWEHDAAKDAKLMSAFTSQMVKKPGAGAEEDALGAVVMAGRSRQVVPASGLRQQTEHAARSNAEFFFPDRPATLEDSHPAKVGDQPAHSVTLKISGPKGSTDHLRMTVTTIDNRRTSFVMGLYGDTPTATTGKEVDAVLRSTAAR
ncbi:APA family fibronectin-binding glycoprotein [Streptomyces hesseae]|uniref:Alanine and proline-rich secreted protein Apa n=1 Tax=Streptomyces hesseae TaxID=3075519 RepID=A0ABU2T0N0_9ACTN|nr:APA family fibronectin-binding glycoprotein [Streptomyces sp. DSM 40473]MDT0453749.1 APA family fibronectin-binding glycoprotein [Streptomyces sp. DSM 40473]